MDGDVLDMIPPLAAAASKGRVPRRPSWPAIGVLMSLVAVMEGCSAAPPDHVEGGFLVESIAENTNVDSARGGADSSPTTHTGDTGVDTSAGYVRPVEIHPWIDDWSNGVPEFSPRAPCTYGARIGTTEFSTLQGALDEAVAFDVVEVCEGRHQGPFRVPSLQALEIRGVSGNPADVALVADSSSPATLVMVGEMVPSERWLRLSSVTLEGAGALSEEFVLTAGRIDIRDVNVSREATLACVASGVHFSYELSGDGALTVQSSARAPIM